MQSHDHELSEKGEIVVVGGGTAGTFGIFRKGHLVEP